MATSFNNGNKFYILGEFTDELTESIVVPLTKQIEDLGTKRDAEIIFYISSVGGNTWMACTIVALLELAKSKDITIKTIVTSHAFNSGSMVSIVGTKGYRFINEYAELKIHYGTYQSGQDQTPLQVERDSEYRKRHFDNILKHYKKYSKVPDLEKLIADDGLSIPADKCIEWGLADKYMGEL